MLVTRIDTHVVDALNRLLQQYKGKPRVATLFTSTVEQIQELEDAIYAIDAGRQIYDGTSTPAIGAQLDMIGQIVGIARNGLTDAQYILFIFGKIAENFSDTTIPTILSIIGYLFQAQKVLIQPIYPAGIAIQMLGSAIPISLYPLATNLIQAALGAGINIVYAGAYPTTKVFRFYSPDTTADNGWGDANDPSVGGVFVDLIK